MNSDNEGMYTNYKSVEVRVEGTMHLLRIWFGKYHVELLPFVCIICVSYGVKYSTSSSFIFQISFSLQLLSL